MVELFGRIFGSIIRTSRTNAIHAARRRRGESSPLGGTFARPATLHSQNRCLSIVMRFLGDATALLQSRRPIETGEQKWLRRDPGLGEVLEKGRAKSGESGSILANARNNVTPMDAVLRAKVYPMHQGHVRPASGTDKFVSRPISGRSCCVPQQKLGRTEKRIV